MVKKIIVIISLLTLTGISFYLVQKTPSSSIQTSNNVVGAENDILKTQFTFNKENLPTKCFNEDSMLCSIENAIKCTINPELNICKEINLPKFIFMKDPGLNRPTEISFNIVNKKVLINNTIEIHTNSSCNGDWFGLCQGTVIYVMAKTAETNSWYVKDIYAIE